LRLVTFRDGDDLYVGEVHDDRVRVMAATTAVEWLGGGAARMPTRVEKAFDSCDLVAPIPQPPSVRDFFAYEEHVRTGWKLRGGDIPPAWYETPVFYFSNPAGIVGPGAEIPVPEGCRLLDFELETAAVIGADGEIAAFTLLNDWSARDIQAKEMSVGLGPAKGKDFATSIGPWLITVDELPLTDGRLDLEVSATINGEEVTRAKTIEQYYSWPEIVEHARRNTRLRPGDVLGSGTVNRGCLLELGPLEGDRWLGPGDVVALHGGPLGKLENTIVETAAGS
jgi:fumarylacetoacetate (FAA) hydrolase